MGSEIRKRILLEIQQLEIRLGELKVEWEEHISPEQDDSVVQEYHSSIARLYELGWDKILEYENCSLPDDLMPEEYRKRHPVISSEILLEVKKLEERLCELVGQWHQHISPEHDDSVVQEYRNCIMRLYVLGWDKILDYEDCSLPDDLMPEEYRKRHPIYPSGW